MIAISKYKLLTHRKPRALCFTVPGREKLGQLLLIGASLFWAAAPVQAGLMIPVADPACDSTDVTLGDAGDFADDCHGYYDTRDIGDTDSPNGKFNGQSPAKETELLNAVTGSNDWMFVYKVDGQDTPGAIIDGIEITLISVDLGGTSGNWTFGWTDTNDSVDANLPVTLDIAAAFKAATSIAYYIFEQELLTDDPYQRSGTFNLQVTNGLSHESLFVRNLTEPGPDPDPNPMPIPGTLALFGLGMLTLRMTRRRR